MDAFSKRAQLLICLEPHVGNPVESRDGARHDESVVTLDQSSENPALRRVLCLDGSDGERRVLGRHRPAVFPAFLTEHLGPVPYLGDVERLSALLLNLPEPGVKLEIDKGRRAERSLASLEVAQIVLEVPVIAPVGIFIPFQSFADEEDGQSGRKVQAFLRAGDSDVDAERVHVHYLGED